MQAQGGRVRLPWVGLALRCRELNAKKHRICTSKISKIIRVIRPFAPFVLKKLHSDIPLSLIR